MNPYVPPGYELLSATVERGEVSSIRDKLASGSLEAYYLNDGDLHFISKKDWIAEAGEAMLECGYWAPQFYKYGNGWGALDHRRISDYRNNRIVIKLPVEEKQKSSPAPTSEYLSPFVLLMIEATHHFKIGETGRLPKKDEIKSWFLSKTLPNGHRVTPTQAEYMATFVRPLEAMKGGQKKMGQTL